MDTRRARACTPTCVHACAHALKQLGSCQGPTRATHSRRAVRLRLSARRGRFALRCVRSMQPRSTFVPPHAATATPVHTLLSNPMSLIACALCRRAAAWPRASAGPQRPFLAWGVGVSFACAGAHRRLPQHRRHRLPPLLTRCKPRRSSASTFVWQRPESGDRCHSQFLQAAIANGSERAAQGARARWLCWPGPNRDVRRLKVWAALHLLPRRGPN